ncbi:MAG: barstar family protein [Planctomycetota bacterium]
MSSSVITIDLDRIQDWASFHDVFATELGFPNYYGRNMDAWIDCMSYLDEPGAGMTSIHAGPGGIAVLRLEHVPGFIQRCPEIYAAIIECSAFVNHRRLEQGESAVIALSFDHSSASA